MQVTSHDSNTANMVLCDFDIARTAPTTPGTASNKGTESHMADEVKRENKHLILSITYSRLIYAYR